MNIVIAGDGEVGFHLAKMLSKENHDITIVDPHRELLQMVESNTDLLAITGDSTSVSVLEQAQVDKADLMISVLHEEQTNIVTSILAKKLGAKRIICRVNNPEYLKIENKALLKSVGIDFIISPEFIAAQEIIHLLKQSAATEIHNFSDGRLSLFLTRFGENAELISKNLCDIADEYADLDFKAIAIQRNGKTIIPKGENCFEPGDLAYIISKPESVDRLLELSGKQKVSINNIMIIGGGRIGRFSAAHLEKQFNIKIIDKNKDRCNRLTEILKNTLVINGDARNLELLEEERIRGMDAFIAVTNDSETNLLTCLMARKFGVTKTIALIENLEYIDTAQSMGVETIINKKLITASYIARFTMDSWVNVIHFLAGIDAEVFEFTVKPKSKVINKPLREIGIPQNALVGGVVRKKQSYIPGGDYLLQEGDHVVVFALPDAIQQIDRLFN